MPNELSYRKSLLRDIIDFKRILNADSSIQEKAFLSKDLETEVNCIFSKLIYETNEDQLFTVEFGSTIIGFIQFYGFNQHDESIFIGYFLDKKFQGKGLLHNACNELVSMYMAQGVANKIYSIISVKNSYSIKFIKKLNFRFEKTLFGFNVLKILFRQNLRLYSISKANF
jgi:RimJ/RimL family protein N-acetyltransferase